MPDYTPKLLRTAEPWTDAEGMLWHPVAAWGLDSEEPSTGFPWQLETTLRLAVTENAWDYLAFTSHFVTGLRDVYEHTFDAWERKQFCEQMLPTEWIVRKVELALNVSPELGHQFLLYRTLQTYIPEGLLKWYALDTREVIKGFVEQADNSASDTEVRETFDAAWTAQCHLAAAELKNEYHGNFLAPAPLESVFDVDADLSVQILLGAGPAANPAMARLLDYLLTANLLHWHDLFDQVDERVLKFKSQGLGLLRQRMEERDPSGRIGTMQGGRTSDEALRLLLRARLVNAVGPLGLWSELGVWEGVSQEPWHLSLPSRYALGSRSPDGEEG